VCVCVGGGGGYKPLCCEFKISFGDLKLHYLNCTNTPSVFLGNPSGYGKFGCFSWIPNGLCFVDEGFFEICCDTPCGRVFYHLVDLCEHP
jgi:hypothetical protein